MNRQKIEEIKKRRYNMSRKTIAQRSRIERPLEIIPEILESRYRDTRSVDHLRSSKKDRITLKCLPTGYKASKLVHNDISITEGARNMIATTPTIESSASIGRVLTEAVTIISSWVFDEPVFIDASVYGTGNLRYTDQVRERLRKFKAGISSSVMDLLASAAIQCRTSAKATPKTLDPHNSSSIRTSTPSGGMILRNSNEYTKRIIPTLRHPLCDIDQNEYIYRNRYHETFSSEAPQSSNSKSTNELCSASHARKEFSIYGMDNFHSRKANKRIFEGFIANPDSVSTYHNSSSCSKYLDKKCISQWLLSENSNSVESSFSNNDNRKVVRDETNTSNVMANISAVNCNCIHAVCDHRMGIIDTRIKDNTNKPNFNHHFMQHTEKEKNHLFDYHNNTMRSKNHLNSPKNMNNRLSDITTTSETALSTSLIRHPIWDTPEELKTSSLFFVLKY